MTLSFFMTINSPTTENISEKSCTVENNFLWPGYSIFSIFIRRKKTLLLKTSSYNFLMMFKIECIIIQISNYNFKFLYCLH